MTSFVSTFRSLIAMSRRALLFAPLVTSAAIAAPTGTPFSPVTAFWRIPDHYKLPADGANDAPSIQRAIDATCVASAVWGRGGTVRLMPRHYTINSQIVIKDCRVTLEGAGWQEAPDLAGSAPASSPIVANVQAASGTWFDIGTAFEGEGKPAPILITQYGPYDVRAAGTVIKDIAFWEPDMNRPAAGAASWTPDIYPPVISAYNVGGYVSLENLYFHGVYRGIDGYNAGRVQVKGLFGQFFKFVVKLDQITDIARVYDVHSWPYWSNNPGVIAWQQMNNEGIILGRVDNPILDNLFLFATAAGIDFRLGNEGGVTLRAEIGKVQCDSAYHCLRIDAPNVTASIGHITSFGQQGIASGVPLANNNIIEINQGGALLAIGSVNGALLDQYAVYASDTVNCSQVKVGHFLADFRNSASPSAALFSAVPCNGSFNQLFVGEAPSIIIEPGQTYAHHNNLGAKVYFPTPTEQP